MKKFFIITALILATAAVIITAYFKQRPTLSNQKSPTGALIKHLKIEPDLIDREIKVPIILFHYIRDIAPYPDKLGWDLSIPPSTFQQQMDYLVKNNYTTITPNDLYEYLQHGQPLPPKPILLTFDDGYLDFFADVFPILRDNQMKAALFVVTNFIGEENYCDWYHLRYLSASGKVFIGGHTQSHAKMTEISDEQLEQEIKVNKTSLEEGLDISLDYFAYPYGSVNDKVLNSIKKNQFKAAFTTENGNIHKTSELLKLPRIKLGGGDTLQTFIDKIKTE